MDILLDYLAWIAIALAGATILFLILAACLLVTQGLADAARWISNPSTDVSQLPAAAWRLGSRLRRELSHLATRQERLVGYIHWHTGNTKPRA